MQADDPPRYPRDMLGHGAAPPDPRWPGGAALAVQIVVNVEEGGERCLLHGDGESEAFLSEIVGADPWPGQRHANMESLYEYGARAGFWRLHRLLTGRGVPVTVFGVASALARAPAQVEAMQTAGWEIASHGLKWIEHKDMPEAEERAQIRAALALHREVTGTPPAGWYTGRSSINTLHLAAAEADFDYLSDAYSDDLPYWMNLAGAQRLILPYTLDANDMRFATAQGFNSGDQFFAYLRDSVDMLLEEGRAGAPKMLSVGLHCRLAGRPGRAAALARFLDHLQAQGDVWLARRVDIARHWRATHPPAPAARSRPSQMDKAAFVGAYGMIFESSPWIAERAWALELGPAHDCAAGVHSALCRVFRAAGDDERLAVLRAHPDLAGKLATARRLTEASTAEQSSAGLDALTDDERAEFTRLNEAYTSKFGHPFIIAVRDHDKAGILSAFRARLAHDAATERAEACRQVERIARLRLAEMLP